MAVTHMLVNRYKTLCGRSGLISSYHGVFGSRKAADVDCKRCQAKMQKAVK